MALLDGLALPVCALVDYDPAGLVIAQSLPHFAGLMAPPLPELVRALSGCTNHARYRSRLVQAQAMLNNATHPDILLRLVPGLAPGRFVRKWSLRKSNRFCAHACALSGGLRYRPTTSLLLKRL
ncbi:MAG: hypothetical protein ABIR56_17355 [Polaromonas sp.]